MAFEGRIAQGFYGSTVAVVELMLLLLEVDFTYFFFGRYLLCKNETDHLAGLRGIPKIVISIHVDLKWNDCYILMAKPFKNSTQL